MCPDYTNPLQYTSSTDGDWQERLQGILDERKHNVSWLHNCTGQLGIDSTVFSTAVYIFDRYLSTFVPAYVKRELAFLEYDLQTIALASLFLAVKSMMAVSVIKVNEMPHSPIGDIIRQFRKYYGSLTRQVFKDKVETAILMALDWNIVYVPPSSIVYDLLSILPQPCEYDEGHEEAFVRYQNSVNYADKLTRRSEWMSGFTIKYPPSTIALAALSIALEDYTDVTGIPIFILVPPCRWCEIEINKRGIDISFDDEDVVRCRNDMMHHFFPTKTSNKDTSERVSADSPTTVAEVHKRRRTTKKRNSFVAKSA